MSVKKKMIIVTVIAVLVVAFFAVAFLATQKSADYYTQIDNDFVTEIPPRGIKMEKVKTQSEFGQIYRIQWR